MTLSIESILSGLTLLLTTIASLRAASRLEARITNGGAIGLMDGPPILGPHDVLSKKYKIITANNNTTIEELIIDNISPLWEQSEGFKRAVVLGLLQSSDSSSDTNTKIQNSIFRDVSTSGYYDDTTTSKQDELAIAAAMEAGLLVPTRGGSVKSQRSGSRRRVLQGTTTPTSPTHRMMNHPVAQLSSWLLRELSAPFSVIPAWHGMLCSFLREQKMILRQLKQKESSWTAMNIWRRVWRGTTFYDSSMYDFNVLLSGVADIPCLVFLSDVNNHGKNATWTNTSVRVKAFAPNTFRDLRNNCFRVSEREYARSVLNIMSNSGSLAADDDRRYDGQLYHDEDDTILSTREKQEGTIPQLLQPILLGRKSNSRQSSLPYISFQSNSKGAARAGTFFFFTADGAYMIKTVKKEEARAFLEMLPEYHKFMSERGNGRNSLLTRFFGMYSVQFLDDAGTDTHSWNGGLYSIKNNQDAKQKQQVDCEERVFLVMNSVFPAEASAFVTERFDLKGSTVGRDCSLEEQRAKGANAVLKDLNLKREVDADRFNKKEQTCGIHIGKQKKCAFMAQLKKDVDLLHRCGVLDYSLLVGSADMEKISDFNKSKKKTKLFPQSILHNLLNWMDAPMPYHGACKPKVDGGHLSCLLGTRRGKQVTYYMGIIDFLQPWTLKKRLERDLKGLAGYDTGAISCVAPSDYAARFLKFMDAHIT